MAIKIINFIKKWVFDLLFPRFCFVCQKEGTWCCDVCLEQIKIHQSTKCPFCQSPIAEGIICQPCLASHGIDQLMNLGLYHDIFWQRLIHGFKYQYAEGLVDVLEKLIKRFFLKYPKFKKLDYDIIIPIPLHHRKLLERNFNQAEAIAGIFSKETGLPIVSSLLIKTSNTLPQAQLSDEERARNIIGAFAVTDPVKIKDKKVILIDDVFTTGATLKEATKVLRRSGVNKVGAWVLARRA